MNDTVKTPKFRKCLVSPLTDPIMAGAPSVIIAVSFAMDRFSFSIAAIIASFTSMPRFYWHNIKELFFDQTIR